MTILSVIGILLLLRATFLLGHMNDNLERIAFELEYDEIDDAS